MDDFVEAAKKQVAKSGKVYKKVTGLRFEGGKWILTAGGKDVIPKDQNDKLGINYTETNVILLKAIQEQQTIIEDLKSRIEALEG